MIAARRQIYGLPPAVFATLAAVVLAAAVTTVLLSLSFEPRSTGTLLSTFALFTVCLLPSMLWLTGDRLAVPIFEAICVSYAAHFGVTALLLPNLFTSTLGKTEFTDAELAATLNAVVFGMLAMVVPYTLLSSRGWLRRVPALDLPLSKRRLRFYLPVAVSVGLVLSAAHASAIGPSGDSPFWHSCLF
jgi:hypothetical protein